MAVVAVLLLGIAVRERSARDSGSARFAGREHRPPRLRMLGGPVAFGWRTTRGVLVAWSAGVALFGAVVGSVVSAVIDLVEDDPDYARTLEELGVDMSDPGEGFLSLIAIAIAMVLGLFVSWRIGALRGEEASGRLEHLLVRPVGRRRWLAASYALAILAALVVALATMPVAVLFAGIGVLLFARRDLAPD